MFTRRIGFSDAFKNYKPKSIIEYLSEIDLNVLYDLVAFYSVNSNFNEKDLEDKDSILEFLKANLFDENSIIINRAAIIFLFSSYLENKSLVDSKRSKESKNSILESVLLANDILNKKQENYSKDISDLDKVESLLDLSFYIKFENSEFDRYDNDKIDVYKLAYCVIFRFNKLIDFLNFPQNINYKNGLIRYFKLDNETELKHYVFNLIFSSLINKVVDQNNTLVFEKDEKLELFLNNIILVDTNSESNYIDYTILKETPIIRKNENEYIVIDYFYLFEKFNKGIKFILKDIYNKENGFDNNGGEFSNFYNKNFIESYFSRTLLDEIFCRKYYIKLNDSELNMTGVPDYYLRIGNSVFLFEVKDNFIQGLNKTNYNKTALDKEIAAKLIDKKGIAQLINHIEKISNRNFEYCDKEYLNNRKRFQIFPILVLNDRIFDTIGFNYKMNKIFREKKSKFINQRFVVNDLVTFDLNTLIFYKDFIKEKDKNFENLLLVQIKSMSTEMKITKKDKDELQKEFWKKMNVKLKPISEQIEHAKLKSNIKNFSDEFSVIF